MPADNTERLKRESKVIGGHRSSVRKRLTASQQEKDANTLSHVEKRLRDHGDGLVELSQTQVMALRAVYDKLRPSLQAIEQTQVDERDKRDPAQVMTELLALIEAKPELLEQLIAMRARNAQLQSVPNKQAIDQKAA